MSSCIRSQVGPASAGPNTVTFRATPANGFQPDRLKPALLLAAAGQKLALLQTRATWFGVARDLRTRVLDAHIPHPRSEIAGYLATALATLTFTFALPSAALAAAADADPRPFAELTAVPLYQFTEPEVGAYLAHLHATEPDLRQRIVHLARKNLGQPYELYLLGEAPFETHDPQPLYSIAKSDCLVFVEHTLAMALTSDWPDFMRLLQRIRYRDGRIGVVTRNHFTEADWNPSNRWLARDITAELAGPRAVKFDEKIDRTGFLKNRYKLAVSIPVEEHHDAYFPYAEAPALAAQLRDGDIVEVVRGIVKKGAPTSDIFGGHAWIGHVGLVAHGTDGTLHLIHSAEPKVREETLAAFIARETAHNAERDAAGKPRLLGFKFLRLEPDPLANLRQLDGPDAPRVTLPSGSPMGK